jgi:hypothetical protein
MEEDYFCFSASNLWYYVPHHSDSIDSCPKLVAKMYSLLNCSWIKLSTCTPMSLFHIAS